MKRDLLITGNGRKMSNHWTLFVLPCPLRFFFSCSYLRQVSVVHWLLAETVHILKITYLCFTRFYMLFYLCWCCIFIGRGLFLFSLFVS